MSPPLITWHTFFFTSYRTDGMIIFLFPELATHNIQITLMIIVEVPLLGFVHGQVLQDGLRFH